jgi:MoaA/NifB/PqqE/SkfB family radical SAM enzyme
MSAAEWSLILDELRALGTLYVTLTGGECLTHPEFFEIAAAVRARAMALRVLTNGALLDDDAADRLATLHASVEMSLHGAEAATHDRTTERPGSFDAVLRAVDRLQARRVPLLLKGPLTSLNENEVEAMLALAEAKGVSLRMDAQVTPRDDGDSSPLRYVASAEGARRLMRLSAARGELPVTSRERGGVNCGLGRVTVTVDPEGNVYPCMQWRRSSLGNARATRLRELWRSSPVREEAAAIAKAANERLLDLGEPFAAFPFCPALAAQHTGDPLTPHPLLEMHARLALEVRTAMAARAEPGVSRETA